MGLKRWFVHARDKNGVHHNLAKVPDYDSTKEHFDELRRWYKGLLERLEAHDHELPDWVFKMKDRITALEADSESLQIQLDNLHHNIQDVEAKVGEPEKFCERCSGRGILIDEYGMMAHADGTCPICEGTGKQSPDTCGNCALPWRRGQAPRAVVCDKPTGGLRVYGDWYTCSYHDRGT